MSFWTSAKDVNIHAEANSIVHGVTRFWGRGLTDDFTEQKLYLILVKLNRISHTKTAAALPKLTVCRDGSFRHSRKSISDQ